MANQPDRTRIRHAVAGVPYRVAAPGAIAAQSEGPGIFVRSLAGLDRAAAEEAPGAFLDGKTQRANQIEFVNGLVLVDYLTEHGSMPPLAWPFEPPYTNYHLGSVDGSLQNGRLAVLANGDCSNEHGPERVIDNIELDMSELKHHERATASGNSADTMPNTTVHYRVVGSARDGFARRNPAIREGPEDAWVAARQLVDFGCLLLEQSSVIPNDDADGQVRRLVMVALLRRALVTTEGIWLLLSRGLEEDANVLTRTLLDVHLNARLVTSDPTPRMAMRLAAYHYLRYQRHGERMLRDPGTREDMLGDAAERAETARIAGSYAAHLKSPLFDVVRDEVKSSTNWHGFPSVADAFKSVGASSDYYMSYDSFTSYVHDSNVDADFVERHESQIVVRALTERDPARVQTSLGFAVFRLLDILTTFVDECGIPTEFEEDAVRATLMEQSVGIEPSHIVLDDFNGMRQRIIEAFPLRGS